MALKLKQTIRQWLLPIRCHHSNENVSTSGLHIILKKLNHAGLLQESISFEAKTHIHRPNITCTSALAVCKSILHSILYKSEYIHIDVAFIYFMTLYHMIIAHASNSIKKAFLKFIFVFVSSVIICTTTSTRLRRNRVIFLILQCRKNHYLKDNIITEKWLTRLRPKCIKFKYCNRYNRIIQHVSLYTCDEISTIIANYVTTPWIEFIEMANLFFYHNINCIPLSHHANFYDVIVSLRNSHPWPSVPYASLRNPSFYHDLSPEMNKYGMDLCATIEYIIPFMIKMLFIEATEPANESIIFWNEIILLKLLKKRHDFRNRLAFFLHVWCVYRAPHFMNPPYFMQIMECLYEYDEIQIESGLKELYYFMDQKKPKNKQILTAFLTRGMLSMRAYDYKNDLKKFRKHLKFIFNDILMKYCYEESSCTSAIFLFHECIAFWCEIQLPEVLAIQGPFLAVVYTEFLFEHIVQNDRFSALVIEYADKCIAYVEKHYIIDASKYNFTEKQIVSNAPLFDYLYKLKQKHKKYIKENSKTF